MCVTVTLALWLLALGVVWAALSTSHSWLTLAMQVVVGVMCVLAIAVMYDLELVQADPPCATACLD